MCASARIQYLLTISVRLDRGRASRFLGAGTAHTLHYLLFYGDVCSLTGRSSRIDIEMVANAHLYNTYTILLYKYRYECLYGVADARLGQWNSIIMLSNWESALRIDLFAVCCGVWVRECTLCIIVFLFRTRHALTQRAHMPILFMHCSDQRVRAEYQRHELTWMSNNTIEHRICSTCTRNTHAYNIQWAEANNQLVDYLFIQLTPSAIDRRADESVFSAQ